MVDKKKPDYAHRITDKKLAKLEKRIAKVYSEAEKDLAKTIDEYFENFKKRDEKQRKKLEAGEITEEYYKQWRLNQIGRGKRFQAMREKVAKRATEANEVARSYVQDATPGIYSLNRNYAAYSIDKSTGVIHEDWTLYDEQTVKRLIVEQPDVMPYYSPTRAVERGIDLKYGKSQITKSVTSSILQGKSIGRIADDLQARITTMSRTSAIRAARTAVTAAQNAGRMDSYVAAEKMGIKLRKRWLSTLDGRTRHAHRELDGQVQDIDKPFESELGEIMYPGDPNAVPANVYQCRCSTIAEIDGSDISDMKRRARDPETGELEIVEYMTYNEWIAKKNGTPEPELKFEGLKGKLSDDFIDGMRQTIKKGESDAIRLFDTFGNVLNVVDANIKGGAYCTRNGVFMNAQAVARGDSCHLPYQTAFHEFAHNIDNINGTGYNRLSAEYENGVLEKQIKEDYKTFKKSMGFKKNADLIDYLKSMNMPLTQSGSVSDILEACTNTSYPLGVGHGKSYHKRPGATSAEFFAEVIDGKAANPDSIKFMRQVFPNAVKKVEEMIGGIIK